jgi:hypothetical protein
MSPFRRVNDTLTSVNTAAKVLPNFRAQVREQGDLITGALYLVAACLLVVALVILVKP